MITLNAENIGLALGGRSILKNINCQITGGELKVLIGPNGAGKSSLLRVLTGASKPCYGRISLNNRSLENFKAAEISQYRAVLSQSVHLGFPLTVAEVVALGLQTQLLPAKKNEIIESALEKTHAIDLKTFDYTRCSGGEQARIQMARILVQLWTSPPYPGQILFLDEPTAALDLKYQIELLNICKELRHHGLAVFCILHDLQLAAHYADEILVMQQGELIKAGKPEDVLDTQLISQTYDVSSSLMPHPQTGKPMVLANPG